MYLDGLGFELNPLDHGIHTVSQQYPYCILSVSLLYPNFILTLSHCILTVPSLYPHCIPTVHLLLYWSFHFWKQIPQEKA